MGCWNATCNISNLPIYAGDEIVLILLMQTTKNVEFNVCYPTDNFVPYAFPIFGKYNDYGGIEKIQISPENEKLIRSYDFYTTGRDEYGKPYVILEINDSFEDFVNDKLCVCGGHYIRTDCANHKDGMAEINYFMAHREVYEMMLKEAGNRIPYGKGKSYSELLKERYMKIIDKYKKEEEKTAKIKEELIEKGFEDKSKDFSEMFMDYELDILNEKIFCASETLSPAKRWWRIMAREYFKTGNDAIIDSAVNKTIFNLALSFLRKGYLCDSGAGSQSQETRMHYIVAQFVIKHISEYASVMNEECEEEDWLSPTGVEEAIFFYGD